MALLGLSRLGRHRHFQHPDLRDPIFSRLREGKFQVCELLSIRSPACVLCAERDSSASLCPAKAVEERVENVIRM